MGARGDALDWALALAQAPGERMALRQRPLPDGIEPLLQIATGSRGDALQEAMARTDETEADLVEAVRFYLREVLFHSGADAYRMLGLARDASAEQIKTHHRLLQQWLHPDRQTSDWDAIFAGRVNAAWNALRTPAHRADYDKAHPVEASTSRVASRPVPRVVTMPVGEGENDTTGRWRRRSPVLALFAACAVLGVVAVRDALRPAESGYAAEPVQVAGEPVGDAEAIALRVPGSKTPPVAAPRTRPNVETPRRAVVVTPPVSAPPNIASTAMVPTPAPALREVPVTSRGKEPATIPPPSQRSASNADAIQAAKDVRATLAAAKPVAPPARAEPVAAVVAEVAPKPASPFTPPAPAVASAERVLQAQRTGRELMTFLGSRSARVPPIWASMGAQQRALGLRDRLHASGELRAGEPHWRVGSEEAALQAVFGGDAQVTAQLVWREQRWLVSGVAMDDVP